MARVLLIFSILIGFVSAFLGFKTKQQAEALQGDLKSTKSSLASTKSKLTTTEKELGETKQSLDETKNSLKQKEEELTNAKGQLETAKSDLAKAQAEVETKSAELAKVDEARKELEKKIGPIPPDQLAAKMEELTKDKARLETEVAEAKQVQETLKTRADELQTAADTKERVIQEYKAGSVRNGLSGKIVAYNPGWNFVVLNIGDKTGLKAGVQMVVVRGGSMVGKVKVTSVEPSTAIADVLPGTIARGDSVQPGDTVVFEGARR